MTERVVTVIQGIGFLGRSVVRHLRDQGFAVRIASRYAQQAGEGTAQASICAGINDEASVAAAIVGAYAAVNAVSLYRKRGAKTFNAVHVKAAERLVRQAHQASVERLVHVSGIDGLLRARHRQQLSYLAAL
jgi:NADH dehydrogenase